VELDFAKLEKSVDGASRETEKIEAGNGKKFKQTIKLQFPAKDSGDAVGTLSAHGLNIMISVSIQRKTAKEPTG